MEFTMGHKYRGSAPLTYREMHKKAEWVGWWGVCIAFVISTYYSVIIAWAISYAIFSVNLSWGTDTEAFLFQEHLDRKSTRLNSSHVASSYAVFCLKKRIPHQRP